MQLRVTDAAKVSAAVMSSAGCSAALRDLIADLRVGGYDWVGIRSLGDQLRIKAVRGSRARIVVLEEGSGRKIEEIFQYHGPRVSASRVKLDETGNAGKHRASGDQLGPVNKERHVPAVGEGG